MVPWNSPGYKPLKMLSDSISEGLIFLGHAPRPPRSSTTDLTKYTLMCMLSWNQ